MGMSLNVDLGVGVEIPIDESGTILSLDSEEPEEVDWDEEDEEEDDLYEFFDKHNDKYPLLEFEYGYSMDYITGAAVFVKRLTALGYYENAKLDMDNLDLTDSEHKELSLACEELKIPMNIQIIAIPSYG